MKRTILTLSVVLAASLASGEKTWESKPSTEWTTTETAALLENSPWSQQQTFHVRGVHPGSSGQPAGGWAVSRSPKVYTISFLSARPVRMARGRWAALVGGEGAEGWEQAFGRDGSNPFRRYVVVSVRASSGPEQAALNGQTTENLRKQTYLLLANSKRRIPLVKYVSPAVSGGKDALFFFPRQEGGADIFTPGAGGVRFRCRLNDWTLLDRKFSLQRMSFRGEFEI